MPDKDSRLITVRRSTVLRVGIAALVLVALGVGTVIGLAVGSKSTPPAKSTAPHASSTSGPVSTTTSTVTSTTTPSGLPAVLSCGPALTPKVRPTMLTIGCATGGATVTGITWNVWEAASGGQGTGTVNQGLLNSPAIVVVFHAVDGIFQDVSVTPSKDVATTVPTTKSTGGRTTSTLLPTTTTTTTAGGIAPLAASQPGSGWGGN